MNLITLHNIRILNYGRLYNNVCVHMIVINKSNNTHHHNVV